ncbi:protein tyrosine phosphatase [Candidatus Woesearchaeota archaeon]|nr:protein tyrosine phosphatase [Candidatus Woesearchaeota archaeon]
MNYLFVCTYNVNRSVVAAEAFKELLKKHGINGQVKHAGVSELAKNRISKELIEWADKIFVMENFHKDFILKIAPEARNKIEVLGIEDLYGVNDPYLLKILKEKLQKELKDE